MATPPATFSEEYAELAAAVCDLRRAIWVELGHLLRRWRLGRETCERAAVQAADQAYLWRLERDKLRSER